MSKKISLRLLNELRLKGYITEHAYKLWRRMAQ